jgi:hypothetical protein
VLLCGMLFCDCAKLDAQKLTQSLLPCRDRC